SGRILPSLSLFPIADKVYYKSVHQHVYPDDLTYGVAYGLAKRWLPQGTRFKVYYDEAVPSLDRGGSVTTIHIEW
ncbi:MAG: hypothetical protein ABI947_00955, partial [Chloroflexota bacterium]